ncbi:MAG: hypothetical protein IKC75_06060 [Clostridia bacterium]|nr:hypothetical protein [Clostridia bacterium]
MGFGLLLIGYFLMNVLPVISVFSSAMLLGLPLILVGLYRLSPYHKTFYFSYFFTYTGIPFALYYTLYAFGKLGVVPAFAALGGTLFAVVQWTYLIWSLAFHILVLLGVSRLSGELGLYGFQSNAIRNLTFSSIYYVLFLFVRLPFFEAYARPFVIPLVILRYLCIFLNLWLFFRTWQVILPEGSDAEPPKERRKEEGKKQ